MCFLQWSELENTINCTIRNCISEAFVIKIQVTLLFMFSMKKHILKKFYLLEVVYLLKNSLLGNAGCDQGVLNLWRAGFFPDLQVA